MLVRAPDHLGDGVMAMPAIAALCQLGPTRVVGPGWTRALYPCAEATHETPDLVVLFKPAFRAAWRWRHAPRRIGLLTDGRWPLLTEAVIPGGRHRAQDYARLARAAGASTDGPPVFPCEPDPQIDPRAALLLPLTASPQTAGWGGFRALADRLADQDRPVLFAAGPGEDDALAAIAGPHPRLPALPLDALAGVAAAVSRVVGNDSGLSHLAAAARRGASRDPSEVHVVFGSTDPARTGPAGCTPHRQLPSEPCWPCYRKRCPHQAACLRVPVEPVLRACAAAPAAR